MTTLYWKKTDRTRLQKLAFRFTSGTLLLSLLLIGGCQSLMTPKPDSQQEEEVEVIKSENDQREYRALELDNGLRVLLISDPDTDKASAAMDVAVGSGSDPVGREGLAHFLEHMLFLGTEKYPEADEYQSFINQHGGGHNAYTAYDHTNYFFEVDAEALEPALDRFSQQFVAPLFTPEYVQREINAVHSEYTAKIKDDGRRFFSVLKESMNPEHPMAKFSVGTWTTLADREEQPIRKDLIEFYNTYYSADIMSLVVYGKEPLDTLESWIRPRFSDVPAHDTGDARAYTRENIWKKEQLPLLVTTRPIKEKRSLTLLFSTPPTRPEYRTKPLYYLSNLIGHEGEGSLLSWLKDQQLAEGLSAGLFSADDNESVFSINIQLSPDGYANWERVVADTFAYIELLKSNPLDQWRFEEQRTMLQTAFRFQDKAAPIHYASGIASRMKDFKTPEVLVAPYLMEDFRPDNIRRFLDALNPENLVTLIQAPDAEVDKEDPWYNAAYAIRPLDTAAIQAAASPSPELALPVPNPFIPEDLSLLEGDSLPLPVRLAGFEDIEAWYARELTFKAPKASFYLSIRTPEANRNARSLVLTELYASLAREQLTEFAYPASLAGLDFRLYKHQRGLTLRIDGFSEKQGVLLKEILKTLTELNYDPELFERFRQDLARDLRNSLKNKPFERLATLTRGYLIHPYWNETHQLEALEDLSLEDLKGFVPELFERLDLVTLSIGNVSESVATENNRIVREELLETHKPVQVRKSQIRRLPAGLQYFSADTQHPDVAYLKLVQGPSKGYPDRAMMGLISQIIGPAYYNQIRTEAQMGYVVFATPFTMMEVPALAFIVQSPGTPAAEIHSATREFLSQFENVLKTMPSEEFSRHKEALITRLTEEDKTLEQRADRYWTEIDVGNPQFNSTQKVADEVAAIGREDLIRHFRLWFLERPHSLLLTATPEGKTPLQLEAPAQKLEDLAPDWDSLELFPPQSSALSASRP